MVTSVSCDLGVARPYEEPSPGQPRTPPETRIVLVQDHLGSTSAVVVDLENPSFSSVQSGSVASTTSHLPYGGLEADSSSELGLTIVDSGYRYTGKEDERNLGIYYFGARYYNPALANSYR